MLNKKRNKKPDILPFSRPDLMDLLMEDGENIVSDYRQGLEALAAEIPVWKPDSTAEILHQLVQEEGKDIYRDAEKLRAGLQEKNLSKKEICQVELIARVSSLNRYLDQLDSGLSAMDINNIILSAEPSGLSGETIRSVVSSILYSLNVPQSPRELLKNDMTAVPAGDLYIPPQAYQERLENINGHLNFGDLQEVEFMELNSYMRAGIPRAYTIMGKLYILGQNVPQDTKKGETYLKYAASCGDPSAISLLADLAYDHDNKLSYQMYTYPGALAVNPDSRKCLRALECSKRFNRTYMLLIAALAVVVESVMLLFVSSPLTGSHPTATALCSLANVVTLASVVIIHIRNPFQDLRHYMLPVLISFAVFILILV